MLAAGTFIGVDTMQLMAQAFGAKFKAYEDSQEHSSNAVATGAWELEMHNDTGVHWQFSYPEQEQNSEHNKEYADQTTSQLIAATDLVGEAEQEQEIRNIVQARVQHWRDEQTTLETQSQRDDDKPTEAELQQKAAKEEKDKQKQTNKKLEQQALAESTQMPDTTKLAKKGTNLAGQEPTNFTSMSAFREPGSWEEFKEAFTAGEDTSISSDNSFYLSKLDILVTRDGSSFSIMNQSAPAKPGAIEKIIEMGLHIAKKSGQEIFTVKGEIFTEVQAIFNALREKGLRPYLDSKAIVALTKQSNSNPECNRFLDEYNKYKSQTGKTDIQASNKNMAIVDQVEARLKELERKDIDGLYGKAQATRQEALQNSAQVHELIEGPLSNELIPQMRGAITEIRQLQDQITANSEMASQKTTKIKAFKTQIENMQGQVERFQEMKESLSRRAQGASDSELHRINLEMENLISDSKNFGKGIEQWEQSFNKSFSEVLQLENDSRTLAHRLKQLTSEVARHAPKILDAEDKPSLPSGPKA